MKIQGMGRRDHYALTLGGGGGCVCIYKKQTGKEKRLTSIKTANHGEGLELEKKDGELIKLGGTFQKSVSLKTEKKRGGGKKKKDKIVILKLRGKRVGDT